MKTAIEYLQNNPGFYYSEGKNIYLKIPIKTKPVSYHYYRVDVEHKLGSGLSSVVYGCYRIDATTLEEIAKPYAAKIFKDRNLFEPIEAELLKKLYFAEDPVEHNNEIFLVHDFFPGETLTTDYKLSPSFQNLTFIQRLTLIQQICLSVNYLHNVTLTKPSIISHADIKGENIKVRINGDKIDVYIFDFGFADRLKESNQVIKNDVKGTLPYSAPEVSDGLHTTKSDIYSLTPLFLLILGASNPFHLKEVSKSREDVYAMPYEFTKLLEAYQPEIPPCPVPLYKYVSQFLHRMHSMSIELRPDSDELLRFFTSLKNYYLTLITDPTDTSTLEKHSTQLALLATNLWSINVKDSVAPLTNNDIEPTKTLGQVSFTAQQSQAINKRYLDGQLNCSSALKIVYPDLPLNITKLLSQQCKELLGIHYPDPVNELLNSLIDVNQDQATKTLQKLRSFTPFESNMLKHCIDYILCHAELNAIILEQLIETLSPLYGLHCCIEFHLNKRLPLQRSSSLFSWFRTNPAEEIAVTRKFLNTINLPADRYPNLLEDFDEKEQQMLAKGKLNEIIEGVHLLIEASSNLAERAIEPMPLFASPAASPKPYIATIQVV